MAEGGAEGDRCRDVRVHLHPKSTEHALDKIAADLKRALLNNRKPFIEKIGCDDYAVLDDVTNEEVNILCKFHKQTLLDTFLKKCSKNDMAQNLRKVYLSFNSMGLKAKKNDIEFVVHCDEESFKTPNTETFDARKKKGRHEWGKETNTVESTFQSDHLQKTITSESTFPSENFAQTTSSQSTFQSDHLQKTITSESTFPSDNLAQTTTSQSTFQSDHLQKTITSESTFPSDNLAQTTTSQQILLRVYIPKDPYTISSVYLCRYTTKEIVSPCFHNITGTQLWELCVSYLTSVKYQVLVLEHKDWKKFMFKEKESFTNEFLLDDNSTWNFQINAADNTEEMENGYFEHCRYIMKSAKEGQEIEFLSQMQELERFSFKISNKNKNSLLKKMTKSLKENCLTQRANCAVFLSFLTQIQISNASLKSALSTTLAKTIFQHCLAIPIEMIPKCQQRAFFEMMETIYLSVENANFLSFCNYIWYRSADVCFTKMSDWACSYPFHPENKDFGKQVLKSFLSKVVHTVEKQDCSKEKSFLVQFQKYLPFYLQIELLREEGLHELISKDDFTEVLLSAYKNDISHLANKGNIANIIHQWKEICSVLSADEVRESTEKYVMVCLEKANTDQLKISLKCLKELCLSNSVILERDSKIKLLKMFAKSEDEDVHSLVAFYSKEKKFQDIPYETFSIIVLDWFVQATKYFCGHKLKGRELSYVLVRLYSYAGDIYSNPFFSSESELLKKMDNITFKFLRDVEVAEMIDALPNMETFETEFMEDIFKRHLREIIKLGIHHEDLNKTDLFELTKTCEVKSRKVLHLFQTLMECTDLKEETEPEEAIWIILSTHHLWKHVFNAKGHMRDDLWKEKLALKAKLTITEFKKAIELKSIKLSMFDSLQDKKELCLELFSLVHEEEDKKFDSMWKELSTENQLMVGTLKETIDFFQLTKKKTGLRPSIKDSIEFCLNLLKDFYRTLLGGKVSIIDAKSWVNNDNLFKNIFQDCESLFDVKKAEVFWNISVQLPYNLDEDEVNEDEDDVYIGISNLFEENDSRIGEKTTHLQNVCNYLCYMTTTVFGEYRLFWDSLLSGKDIQMSVVQERVGNVDTMHELLLAERIFKCEANLQVREALKLYCKFEEQSEKVVLLKDVFSAFRIDVTIDVDLQKALFEYEKLLNGDITDMSLFHVGSSLSLVENVLKIVKHDMIPVLEELQRASVLIEFLETVVNEDIRNLIDAVEEHSEQFVRESTVSDLIDVKRFLQPILKEKHKYIQGFFEILSRSLRESGIKKPERKIHECSSNVHSLKALYNHVANRGEHTNEIIENIVEKGLFHFVLEGKECDVSVEYNLDEKPHVYSKTYLNDLRSRALLILNTEEKQPHKLPTFSSKKKNLTAFIEIIDSALDISHLCTLLKQSGHFQFVQFDQKTTKETLSDFLIELKLKYKDWCKVLFACRQRFYLMNYIQSDQLQALYNFGKFGHNQESVITILKFINPAVSNLENIMFAMKNSFDHDSPEENLEILGKTLDTIGTNLVPSAVRMFDGVSNSKPYEKVQAGKIFVAALEPDSQLVIRTLLGLHWHTTQTIPFAHNILLCNGNTSQDEITLFLNRCIGCKVDQLFSIANVEKLTHKTQDFMINNLMQSQVNTTFRLSIICRGKDHPFLERFRDFILRPKPLTENELQDFFDMKYPHVLTVTSDVSGLGKSEEIQRLASQKGMGKITLHISGIFDRETLVEELLRLEIKQYHALHIDIGPVNEPEELDAFLFELVVLKHVSARKLAFHLQTDHVFVEIGNSINRELSNSLPTMTSFRKKHIEWKNYDNIIVSQEVNSPIQVVCHYLRLQDLGKLDTTDLNFTGETKVSPLSKEDCRNLLQKHFSTFGDMSFTIVNIFLGVLADQLKKLSSSIFFRASNIQKDHKSVKTELVKALKDMSIEFSSRSITSCRSAQILSKCFLDELKSTKTDETLPCAEILAKRTEGMIRWEDSNHLMVLFHHDLQTVSALYKTKEKLPTDILDLFESQLKRKLGNYNEKSQEELLMILSKLVQFPGTDVRELNEMTKHYALTPDNLLKMVLIVLRIQGHQPIIIMGETGCGKTSLVRFLSVVCNIDFQLLSIHAGTTEDEIVTKLHKCDSTAKQDFRKCIWLFLDEINTCDHLGLICDVLCHHSCKGKLLSPNLKILAACNPYRLRSELELTKGLQGKIKTDHLSKLVYRVNPLPETMIDYVWDYGSLQANDEEAYIARMVQELFQDAQLVQLFVQLLIISQKFVKKKEGTDCCVSLRDVERCKRLVFWFVYILKKKAKSKNYDLSKIESTAIILALSICYHSRFPDNKVRESYRKKVAKCCKKFGMSFMDDDKNIEQIIVEQQNDILNRMELPPGTAKNTALRENVFVILVCILNRIPVFVVGKPGCSKSLSMQLIRSNLRGKDSSDSFFRKLPQLYCVSFQGSESSTSEGIFKVFEKAKNYQSYNQSEDVFSVVILDEIGLAEISRFNPLKVLHNLLEPENRAMPDVAVVGISNWALDAAKMNRAIHLSRPEMDEKELFKTALSITESLFPKRKREDDCNKITGEVRELLCKLSKAYSVYSKRQKYRNFHGLRDFYSLAKYIGKGLLLDKQNDNDVILRGLLRNLGGLSRELRDSMLLEFEKFLQIKFQSKINALDLIQDNLQDKQSRHLMLITNGDAVLSVIEDTVKKMKRQHVVIFGSRFEYDLTDDYNYRILSRIILCMEQGYVLILKDLENIYGSLYDMLNQNYTTIGSKKNCRVALGPYSNPMCHVHEDFKCIVLLEESKLDFSDPPFLNRFEKQQFRFEDIMDENAIQIKNDLIKFTKDVCDIDGHSYKPENAFALSGEHVISSLVLKIQKEESDKEKIFQKCLHQLLWITTPEAMIRIGDSVFGIAKPNTVKRLEKMYYALPIHDGLCTLLNEIKVSKGSENCEVTEDSNAASLVAVFTYDPDDHFLNVQASNIRSKKLRNFKSEKHFNQTIEEFYESDSNQLLLHCSVEEDLEHILLAKSSIESYQKKMSKPKLACIICHLKRKHKPVIQINFLSGWHLVMLDTLCKPRTPLPELRHLTIHKALDIRRPMIDVIQNHIFWAFSTIQYVGAGHSAEKMMNTVRGVKESSECLSVLEELVFSSIHTQKDNLENWQKNIACNEHALVMESCYMNALEQYLLNIVKSPLSKIIFKLEEANAFESTFINDSRHEERTSLWKKLCVKSSLIDISNIPDPSGPECYTCSSERYSMKLPFSYIVLNRVEKIKNEFIHTLKQIKILCDLDEHDENNDEKTKEDNNHENNEDDEEEEDEEEEEDSDDDDDDDDDDDEIPKTVLTKLVAKYSEIIKQHVEEYLETDYLDKFNEYQHDFDLMMYSHKKGNLTEEERVQLVQFAQTLFDREEIKNDFALHVTNVHVLHWTYGSVLDSIVEIVEIVKGYTDVSLNWLFQFDCEQTTTGNTNSERYKRFILVDRLSKTFLPTTKLLARFPSVQEWQFQVSRALPCFAEISLSPPSIHMLRFCNDVAHAMFSCEKSAAVEVLSILGDELEMGTHLESVEMFRLVAAQLNIAREKEIIDAENHQHLVYQYLSRSITNAGKNNATLKCFFKSLIDESTLDRYLRFFGPILDTVIGSGKATSLIDIKTMKKEGYLHWMNKCLTTAKGGMDSTLSSILVIILQEKYLDTLRSYKLENIKEKSDKICTLAFKACDVLRKKSECDVNTVASIAYLRSVLLWYTKQLKSRKFSNPDKDSQKKDPFEILTQKVEAVIKSGAEENELEDNLYRYLQEFFLKCLFSRFELNELKPYLLDWTCRLPTLKSVDCQNDFLSRSLTFHPLSLYGSFHPYENEYLNIEKLEKERQKEIIEIAMSNDEEKFFFVGCMASSFFLKSQQREMNDTFRAFSKSIFEMIQAYFLQTQRRVVELVLKITDFNHPLLQINTETKTPDIQIVSVLTHLLSLIVLSGQSGNLWYDILTDVSDIKTRYLPGVAVEELNKMNINDVIFCDHCKLRFSIREQQCPKCYRSCENYASSQDEQIQCRSTGYEKPNEKLLFFGNLSPVTYHLLQFFINGCLTLTIAANYGHVSNLKTLLCVEDDPSDELKKILFNKWEHLKKLTQLSNEDLCAFIHIVIHELRTTFTTEKTPNHCKSEQDSKKVEERFQLCIEKLLKEKYTFVGEARLAHGKKYGMTISSLECQVYELSERPAEIGYLFPSLFRLSSPATKDGLVAQVFLDNNPGIFPFLKLVLMTEDILELPKLLIPMLRWHQCTVSLGSYKMRKVDCNEETLEAFFRMEKDDIRRENLRIRFKEFKTAWDELIGKQMHFPDATLSMDTISTKSKVINCIITDENSLILKIMMELVKIHNHFIDCCLHFASTSNVSSLRFLMTGEHLSEIKSISLWELSSRDIIEFSSSIWSKELLRYSQCKLGFGEGQDRYYNLQKIENELSHFLILGKRYISVPETIPRILFVDELFQNTIQLLNNIKRSIKQERLPKNILMGIVKKIKGDSSTISELIAVIGMSLSLLKRTKGETSTSLKKYLEDWKCSSVFPKNYESLLPEQCNEVKLCHVVNLYVKLEEMSGETIHDTLNFKYKVKLPDESKEKLETAKQSCQNHLEVLAESLKIFIHRCLSLQNNAVSVDQMLIEYMMDETFWPHGNLQAGQLSVGKKTVKLSDILCTSLCVKHIFETVSLVNNLIQKKQDIDQTAYDIAEAEKARIVTKTKKKKKNKNAKEAFGKT